MRYWLAFFAMAVFLSLSEDMPSEVGKLPTPVNRLLIGLTPFHDT